MAGHGRLDAALMLGMEKVPVDMQDFKNEADEYAFLEADNHIARYAEFDQEKMLENLSDLEIEIDTFDFEEIGMIDFELPQPEVIGLVDEDDVPEVKENPVTKCGDIWLLGQHRVMCGDSTMIDDVDKLMNGEKADMIHTDPPYNIAYRGGSKKRDEIKNDDMGDNFPEFLNNVYSNLFLSSNPGAAIYVWHASSETHNFINEYLKCGFLFKSYIIWNKNNSTFGRSDYHWKHEPCIYGWNGTGSHKWYGDRKQTTVWDLDRPSVSDLHPTMKPVSLCEIAIENSSIKGFLILDVFLGSGSTLIACEKTGRKCYGMELDEKYCDVIIKRWQDFTGKEATLESTGETFNERQKRQTDKI